MIVNLADTASPIEKLYRLAAFSSDPAGGNPAGVWMGPELPSQERMQSIAAEVGYSETAFLTHLEGERWKVRYYSALAEVPFCGHATIASGVQLGRTVGAGAYRFETTVGDVQVNVGLTDGEWEAALTSVTPRHEEAPEDLLRDTLGLLGWRRDEVDPAIPPVRAYAGAWHLVLAAATRERLASLSYDFDRMQRLMLDANLTTLQLIWRESQLTFRARNPFPVGGVVEDPATGAAAAALGGYLREAGMVSPPVELEIRQGAEMGRPSLIRVQVPVDGGITVRGTAVDLLP